MKDLIRNLAGHDDNGGIIVLSPGLAPGKSDLSREPRLVCSTLALEEGKPTCLPRISLIQLATSPVNSHSFIDHIPTIDGSATRFHLYSAMPPFPKPSLRDTDLKNPKLSTPGPEDQPDSHRPEAVNREHLTYFSLSLGSVRE